MPIAPKLEVPSGWPGFPLAQALERYLWLDEISPVRIYGAGRLHAGSVPVEEWYEIRGMVKPGLTIGEDGEVCQGEIEPVPEPATQDESYTDAHKVRESLLGWANTAIVAAEEAGYRHVRHPEINVTGDLRAHHREPQKPDTLICKVEVRLWLREDPA